MGGCAALQARGDDGSDKSGTTEKRYILKVGTTGFLEDWTWGMREELSKVLT